MERKGRGKGSQGEGGKEWVQKLGYSLKRE